MDAHTISVAASISAEELTRIANHPQLECLLLPHGDLLVSLTRQGANELETIYNSIIANSPSTLYGKPVEPLLDTYTDLWMAHTVDYSLLHFALGLLVGKDSLVALGVTRQGE